MKYDQHPFADLCAYVYVYVYMYMYMYMYIYIFPPSASKAIPYYSVPIACSMLFGIFWCCLLRFFARHIFNIPWSPDLICAWTGDRLRFLHASLVWLLFAQVHLHLWKAGSSGVSQGFDQIRSSWLKALAATNTPSSTALQQAKRIKR